MRELTERSRILFGRITRIHDECAVFETNVFEEVLHPELRGTLPVMTSFDTVR